MDVLGYDRVVAAVPEPSTFVLLASGLVAIERVGVQASPNTPQLIAKLRAR